MKFLSIVILLALVLSGCAGSNISSSASFLESEIVESEVSTPSLNSINSTSQSSEACISADNVPSAVSSHEQAADTDTVSSAVSSVDSKPVYSQSANEGTNLYTDAPANTKQEKMTILNGRFELKLPEASKVVNFHNEDACLYAVLEYSPKDYKKIIDKKLISNNFDCFAERKEENYNNPQFFDPIYKPLKRETWWDISLNSNVVLSYTRSIDLINIANKKQLNNNKVEISMIQTPSGVRTAIYVVKTKKNTYKFYCALESYALYSGERKDTTLPLPLADSDSLTPTYVSYPQKSEKDKMYIIEHRTQNMKKLPEPISVDNFYNDAYCMYACLTYDEKAIDEIFKYEDRNIGLDILAPSLKAAERIVSYKSSGKEKTAKIHSLFQPLADISWWNFGIDEIEKCSTSTIMIFDFYEPTDRIDKSTCRLPSGEKVMPMRASGDGYTFYVAVKDGENYKLYISHENKTLFKMHLNGTLLPGTYGK